MKDNSRSNDVRSGGTSDTEPSRQGLYKVSFLKTDIVLFMDISYYFCSLVDYKLHFKVKKLY